MDAVTKELTTQQLSLPDELVLMLLNEQTGYFHQVPGWKLNCAVVDAVLAELSLLSRIDTDMNSLHLLDGTPTGNPVLDPVLRQIAEEANRRSARYWVERLTVHAELIIDLTLDRLVDLEILEYHDGDFWTLAPVRWHTDAYGASVEDTADELIRTRITKVLFFEAIPDPRDIIVVCLVNTCDVFRYIFDIDDEIEERIEAICRMDLIGRSIAEAVSHNQASPLLRRSALPKQIPAVSLPRLLLNPHLRTGNVPALFADLASDYGPVFQVRPPFRKPMIFLAGPEANHWMQKRGRKYREPGTISCPSRPLTVPRGFCPPLTGPITSGFASPCRQHIHVRGWKVSWINFIIKPGHSCQIGRLATHSRRQARFDGWSMRKPHPSLSA